MFINGPTQSAQLGAVIAYSLTEAIVSLRFSLICHVPSNHGDFAALQALFDSTAKFHSSIHSIWSAMASVTRTPRRGC